MKMFYVILGLAILIGVPHVSEAYSFWGNMPGNAGSYDEWLASVNASTSSSGASAVTSFEAGRLAGYSEGGALSLGFFTQTVSNGTKLYSTPGSFLLLVR